jgi:hypothetical protein
MDAKIDELLRKTAEYVEVAQQEIDRSTDRRAAFLKRAGEVAEKLASKGVIPAESVDAFNKKIAENEVEVWSLVEKLADALSIDNMGQDATGKIAAQGRKLDPFERWILFGNPRAEGPGPNSGMLE